MQLTGVSTVTTAMMANTDLGVVRRYIMTHVCFVKIPGNVTENKDGHNVEDNPGKVHLPVTSATTAAVKRKSVN